MKIIIADSEDGLSLRDLLKGRLKLSSKSLKRLKYREDGLTVNGTRVTVRYVLHAGDELVLDASDGGSSEERSRLIQSDLPVNVIYSDGFITVSDKPPYMPTHPVHGHLDDTLANALAYRSGNPDYVFRPLGRLDRNTSGIVVSSDDFLSSGKLSSQLLRGEVRKTYLAIVTGAPAESEGVIDAPIARAGEGTLMRIVDESGERAVTEYRVIRTSRDRSLSLVRLRPLTGRTHQIRVHMSYIGCPLLGDFLYGEESGLIGRHALHACRMEFSHPKDGRKMVFCSALPDDMAEVLRRF